MLSVSSLLPLFFFHLFLVSLQSFLPLPFILLIISPCPRSSYLVSFLCISLSRPLYFLSSHTLSSFTFFFPPSSCLFLGFPSFFSLLSNLLFFFVYLCFISYVPCAAPTPFFFPCLLSPFPTFFPAASSFSLFLCPLFSPPQL